MLKFAFILIILSPIPIFLASTYSTLIHELRHAKEFSGLRFPSYIVLFRKMEVEQKGLYEKNWEGCLSIKIKRLDTTIYFPSIFSCDFKPVGFFNTRFRKQQFIPIDKVKKIAAAPSNPVKLLLFPTLILVVSIVLFFYMTSKHNTLGIGIFVEILLYSMILLLLNLMPIANRKANSWTRNDRYYYENPIDWYD